MKPIVTESFHWRSIYSVGLFVNTFGIYLFHSVNGLEWSILILVLYEAHLLKRCVEVYCSQPWVKPPRFVGSFLFLSGVSYYVVSPITFLLGCLKSPHLLLFGSPLNLLGALLFIYCCYHQYKCHKILYLLASEKNKNPNIGYQIPKGDLFELLYCPHYSTEIGMYLSLNIILCFSYIPCILCLAFTSMNLGYHSIETYHWYQTKFSNKLPQQRKVLIPYLF